MVLPRFLALLIRPESRLHSSLVNFNTVVPAEPLIKEVESRLCGKTDHRKHIPWFHISFSLLLCLPFADSFLLPSTNVMRCDTSMLLTTFDVLSLLVSLGNISIA